jgi:dihydrofolate synthase/folylpolyglutamate synthase
VLDFETKNINLGLERMTKVLARLGDPHLKFKSIHVAGTNGKGSVCAMLEAILREAGYKVGLYTSPHLFKPNERVKIQGDDISDWRLERGIEKVKKAGEGLDLTTFEILTCVAFDYFADHKVDVAVVEVGLGGRLDATNVITPLVSVITNIDYDHTEYLGNTLREIATEKAGIIKPGVPVVTAEDKPEALEVIQKACQSKEAGCWVVGKEARIEARSQLLGPHQRRNEALAVKVAELLKIDRETIKRGIAKAFWPGRFQIISSEPVMIVDGAHNVAGAQALKETIEELKIQVPLTLVLGIQGYKNIRGIVEVLAPLSDNLIVTRSSHPQAARPDEIAAKIDRGRVMILYSVKEAVEVARGLGRPVLVTGSLFLVADVLTLNSL